MKKRLSLLLFGCLSALPFYGQQFDDYFTDRTLRVDYIFAGTADTQNIYVDRMSSQSGWAGRRHNLSKLPLDGNGQITVTDAATDKVIYRHSFSSLFQEWQTTEEAVSTPKSFENVFLLPFPKREAKVEVSLNDTHGRKVASISHTVRPDDILIKNLDNIKPNPYKYILRSASPDSCIDVAFVAEGYTESEMEVFYRDCNTAMAAILEHSPFKELKDRFNFVAVASPSDNSGVSIPGKNMWMETAVGSNFDTFYSERYLTTLNLRKLHDQLVGIPYEHIVILANTNNYGGGGIYNSYTLTTAHHPMFAPVVVHEFGHSFGGLADEYYYDDGYEPMYHPDTEPWEQNITTLKDFDKKWKDMLPEGTPVPTPATATSEDEIYNKIGVYEGGGYQSKGVYRPVQECRMKINEAPHFCPVCQRALDRLIRFYTE